MRTRVDIPEEIVDEINIATLSDVIKYIHILKILPAKTASIGAMLRTDMLSAEAVITELDNFGLARWHKNDGIVHRTRKTRTIMNILKTMKLEIKPDAQKIIMKKVNSTLKRR